MDLTINEISNADLAHTYDVSMSSQIVSQYVDQEVAKITKNVTIEGYRKGHAPKKQILKRYKANIDNDVLDRIFREAVSRITTEYKLQPIATPEVEELKFSEDEGFKCKIVIENTPTIPEIDFKKISVNRYKAEITSAMILEEVNKAKTLNQNYIAADESAIASEQDKAWIDFLGKIDDVEFKGGKGENYPLVIGSNSFIPGFEEQVKGMKIGESKDIQVNFPENYHVEDLKSKPAIFTVKLNKLEKPEEVKMDDEFAKKIGFTSYADLEEKIKSFLEQNHQVETMTIMKKELFDNLENILDFKIPKTLYQKQLHDVSAYLASEQGKPHEHNHAEEGHSCFDHLSDKEKEQADKISIRRVKAALYFQKLIKDNKLSVSQEEIKQAVVNRAMRYPDQAQMIFERFMKDKQLLENLHADLLEEKAIEFILDKVDVKEHQVSVEELSEKIKTLDNF